MKDCSISGLHHRLPDKTEKTIHPTDKRAGELADLLEVLRAVVKARGWTWESWRRSSVFGAVSAARVCAFPCKAERMQMNDSVVIIYSGQQVSRQRGSQTSRSRIENGNRRRTNGIIGTIYGVSKVVVSKQLKKLHEQLRD